MALKETLKNISRSYVRFKLNFHYAYNPRKPLLVLRILKGYFDYLILNKIPLRYVDIAVGYGCNLHCQHCSASKFLKMGGGRLSMEQFKELAQQCLKLGLITVGFTGGEPTLYHDIEEIIKAFQPHKLMVSLITNATLLNSEKIKKFKQLGVDILCVSLDSFFETEHDAFRGVSGAYHQALKSINLALNNKLKVIIVTTVTHNNLRSDSITELIKFTERMKLLLIFSLACPAGKWSESNENLLLDQEDIAYMNELFIKYQHLRRDFESNWWKKGCGAGKEKLYVTAYGDIIPCPFIHISFGNIKNTNLKIIRSRMLKVPEFAVYHPKCLSGEDRDFSRKYVLKANLVSEIPVGHETIFKDVKSSLPIDTAITNK